MIINVLTPSPDFRDLIRRMLAGDTHYPRPVAWTTAHNIFTDEPRLVAKIMEATADLSVRCRRPAYAFTIGWHADEDPTPDTMKSVTLEVLYRAGLGEHQALIIAPADRIHPCVRVVVNRIHLETGRAWSASFDYRRFDMIARDLAQEHGFSVVPSHRYRTTAA